MASKMAAAPPAARVSATRRKAPELPMWQSVAFSAAAPTMASVVTSPFGFAKTVLQLQGVGGQERVFRGTFHFFSHTLRHEGLAAVQRGLSATMMREASKNLFRLGMYRPLMALVHDDAHGPAPVYLRMAAGAASGAVGAFASNGFEVVKTRLQAAGLPGGHNYGYSGTVDAFRRIVRDEGVATLYKAVGPSMARSMIGTSVNLTSYTLMRERVVGTLGDSPVTDVTCSLLSGFFTTAAMAPLDTARSRLMNQPQPPVYRGAVHCLATIARTEGPAALFKGFVPSFLRLGPHFVLTFALLEQMRRSAHGYNARRAQDSFLSGVFRRIDADGSGELDKAELVAALHAAQPYEAVAAPGVSRDEFERAVDGHAVEIFERADADRNGSIDLQEFLAAARASDLDQLLRGQQLLATFRQWDLDGNHSIDEVELYQALRATRDVPATSDAARHEFERQLRADVARVMHEVDEDGNGAIDFFEFVRAADRLEDLTESRVLEGWARSAGVAQE